MKTLHRLAMIIGLIVAAGVVPLWGENLIAATSVDLDGKTFTCPTGNKGMSAHDQDEVSFNDGKLHSALFDRWGFGQGVYTSMANGDEIHFQAETSSPEHGKIVWKGKVKGDRLDITYNWMSKAWHWKDHHGESWCKGALKG